MSVRKSDAVKRTVPMPGVSLREEKDQNAIDYCGPLLRKATFSHLDPKNFEAGLIHQHLVRVDRCDLKPLCGAPGVMVEREIGKRTCEACRVEASRIGGVVK